MRTKCKRSHCSSSRRMLQGAAPLRSLSKKSENGCTAMTSLLNECCKTPQSKPLSEKSKNMRRCRCFSPSPILPPSERAKSWRGICRTARHTARHKARNDFYAKRARVKTRLRTYPAAALSRYAEEQNREITSLSGSRQNSSVDRRSKKRSEAFRRQFTSTAISLRRRQ